MHARTPILAALAILALFVSPSILSGFTLKSISVDGNVLDWDDVLVDPENSVPDAAAFSNPPDPDMPGTADRDIRAFSVTWDGDNLYFFLRRTLSGNNSFNFLVYIDADHDALLESTDYVASFDYNGAAFQEGILFEYVPADPAGDPITGDGVNEPGSAGTEVPGTSLFGANSPDGIEFEMRLPWSDLGVAAGTCLWFHSSVSNGTNLPGQVQDNSDPIDGKIVDILLETDHIGTTSSPGTIQFSHRLCQQGNCEDTLDVSLRSDRGWTVRIYSDPNGDGDPSDGILLGEDQNGDGDFEDDADFIDPSADSNANELVDSGPLGEGICVDYVVELVVPTRVPQDRDERVRVRARSSYRPSAVADNFDRIKVGDVVVYPNRNSTGLAGATVNLPHLACNNQDFTDTVALAISDDQGWVLDIWSDPNGDGDPSDGNPISSTGPLARGACRPIVARVSIPGGTAVGTVDAVLLSGTSQADPDVVSRAHDTVTVAATRFALTPDHDVNAGPGDSLYFSHLLTNNGTFADSYTLSGTSTLGSTLTFLTDPNGNGLPDDSTTIPAGTPVGPIGPFGGSYQFLLKVETPPGAAYPDVDTILVTATSEADSATASATDIIRIQKLLTYSDPLFARPTQNWFSSCATIHAQAYGLATNDVFRFIWSDPLGSIVRTGPEIRPDNKGRTDDSYTLTCNDLPGVWQVKLQIKSGSRWNDVPNAVASFNILDDAAGEGGDITSLRTSREIYNYENDSVGVAAVLDNDTVADYLGTLVQYVIFLDQNGDGVPTAGEPYILPDGSRGIYTNGVTTHETRNINVLAGNQYEDLWRVDNVDFQDQTEWCVWARWATDCDCGPITIDTRLACFLVSCFPVPLVEAGLEKDSCPGDPLLLDDASSDGDIFFWSDGGSGGGFTPSPDMLNPAYANPAAGTYTLDLTATYASNGCSANDQMLFTVHPRPVIDAGATKDGCVGEPVSLDDATQSGGDLFAWDDGGSGGAFLPSPEVLQPTWSHPLPGLYPLSLTVTDTTTPAACEETDSLSVSLTSHPVVDAGSDRWTCLGAGVPLNQATQSGGDAFLWADSGAGGTFAPSPDVLQPTWTAPGLGTFTLVLDVTDTSTPALCDTQDSLSVEVLTDPFADAGPDKTLTCAQPLVTLEGQAMGGSGAYSYRWEPAAEVSNPDILRPTTITTGTFTLTVTDLTTGCISVDEVIVDQSSDLPTVSAGPDRTLTCDTTSVQLEGSATGGSGNYSYRWDPAGSVSDPDIAQPTTSTAGQYILTVTDLDNGCAATDIVVVAENIAVPVAEAGPDPTLTCETTVVTLQGSASGGDGSQGYVYLWAPAGDVSDPGTAQPDTSTAGTYTLTVTDVANGCMSSDTVTVSEDLAAPIAEAGPGKTLTCETTVVQLEGSASGGNGSAGYTYQWDPAAQVSDPAIADPDTSVAGSYTLTVTDLANGCTATDTVTIDENVAVPQADAGPDLVLDCSNPTVTLAGSASGGDGSAGYSFRWEPASGVSDPDIAQPDTSNDGTYTLTVTDLANGCTATDVATVTRNDTLPVADAGPDKELTCETLTVVLEGAASGGDGSAGYTYRWEPASDVSDPDAAQPTTSKAGIYTLTITDIANGCTAEDSVEITGPLVVPPAEPSALDLDPGVPPFLVAKSVSPTDVTLEFQWEATALTYNLYRGTLDSLHAGVYDHAPFGLCDLSAPAASTVSQPGTWYYLVVSDECVVGEESSYGRASSGAERPDALTASGSGCP